MWREDGRFNQITTCLHVADKDNIQSCGKAQSMISQTVGIRLYSSRNIAP